MHKSEAFLNTTRICVKQLVNIPWRAKLNSVVMMKLLLHSHLPNCGLHYYAWFTFSLRQYETRRERKRKGYIRLIFHTLDLFSSRLEALWDMLVNQSRVKGNENVSYVLPRYQRFLHESVIVYIREYFVLFASR